MKTLKGFYQRCFRFTDKYEDPICFSLVITLFTLIVFFAYRLDSYNRDNYQPEPSGLFLIQTESFSLWKEATNTYAIYATATENIEEAYFSVGTGVTTRLLNSYPLSKNRKHMKFIRPSLYDKPDDLLLTVCTKNISGTKSSQTLRIPPGLPAGGGQVDER